VRSVIANAFEYGPCDFAAGEIPPNHTYAVADSRGEGGGRPPIDWMHLETSENFAPKCMIFE